MSEETTTIPTEQLEALLEQNRQFLNSQQVMQQQLNELAAQADQSFQPIIRDETNQKRTVRIAYLNDKPVLGMKNRGSESRPLYIYERPDPMDPKVRIAFADLIIAGEDEPVTVNFIEFQREADAREMEILDTRKEPWEVTQGFVQKKEWTGSEMVETAVRVPVKVKGERRHFKVKDATYGEIEISEQWVNIR